MRLRPVDRPAPRPLQARRQLSFYIVLMGRGAHADIVVMSKIYKSISDGLSVRIKFMGQYGRPSLALLSKVAYLPLPKKEVMFLVHLFYLSVRRITRKLVNGF